MHLNIRRKRNSAQGTVVLPSNRALPGLLYHGKGVHSAILVLPLARETVAACANLAFDGWQHLSIKRNGDTAGYTSAMSKVLRQPPPATPATKSKKECNCAGEANSKSSAPSKLQNLNHCGKADSIPSVTLFSLSLSLSPSLHIYIYTHIDTHATTTRHKEGNY